MLLPSVLFSPCFKCTANRLLQLSALMRIFSILVISRGIGTARSLLPPQVFLVDDSLPKPGPEYFLCATAACGQGRKRALLVKPMGTP